MAVPLLGRCLPAHACLAADSPKALASTKHSSQAWRLQDPWQHSTEAQLQQAPRSAAGGLRPCKPPRPRSHERRPSLYMAAGPQEGAQHYPNQTLMTRQARYCQGPEAPGPCLAAWQSQVAGSRLIQCCWMSDRRWMGPECCVRQALLCVLLARLQQKLSMALALRDKQAAQGGVWIAAVRRCSCCRGRQVAHGLALSRR